MEKRFGTGLLIGFFASLLIVAAVSYDSNEAAKLSSKGIESGNSIINDIAGLQCGGAGSRLVVGYGRSDGGSKVDCASSPDCEAECDRMLEDEELIKRLSNEANDRALWDCNNKMNFVEDNACVDSQCPIDYFSKEECSIYYSQPNAAVTFSILGTDSNGNLILDQCWITVQTAATGKLDWTCGY